MDQQLEQLAAFVANANSVEGLTRPLLTLLQRITGLESIYLTSIDETTAIQQVNIAYNAGTLTIQEGLTVPWRDTLCKRALDSNTFVTDDVPSIWGDSAAAKALGLQSYISVPMYTEQGKLMGTLCGASSKRLTLAQTPEYRHIIALCADLISHQWHRETASQAAHARADAAETALNRVKLLSAISEFCVAAQSLSLAMVQVASYMQQSGYWQQVMAFDVADGHFTALLSAHQQWQQPLHSWRSALSAAALQQSVQYLPATKGPMLAADLSAALVNIYVGHHVVAAILVLPHHQTPLHEHADLLAGIGNALTLLAARLDEHDKLLALNQQFAHAALHDALTGLPNRRYLMTALEGYLAKAQRQQHAFALAFVDLDKFKAINDHFGHETGDNFLQAIAARLQQSLRKDDFLARQGGDEFVLICPLAERNLTEIPDLQQRLRQCCTGQFTLARHTFDYAGPSIGVVLWQPGDTLDLDLLLSQADAAMYEDKLRRRGGE